MERPWRWRPVTGGIGARDALGAREPDSGRRASSPEPPRQLARLQPRQCDARGRERGRFGDGLGRDLAATPLRVDGGSRRPGDRSAFGPDGVTLASASTDVALLRDVSAPRPHAQALAMPEPFVSDIAFSPDGSLLAAATSMPAESPDPDARPTSAIRLGTRLRASPSGEALSGSAEEPVVAFSDDGRMLAGATANDTVELWDLASARTQGRPLREEGTYIRYLDFSPDGSLLAAVRRRARAGEGPREDATHFGDPEVRLRALDSFGPAGVPFAKGAARVDFAPEGRGLFVADEGLSRWKAALPATGAGACRAWGERVRTQPRRKAAGDVRRRRRDPLELRERLDLGSASRLGEPIQAHRAPVSRAPPLGPDGSILATSGEDGTMRLWDVATRRQLGEPIRTGLRMSRSARTGGH